FSLLSDVTDVCQSDSFISKNTSLLKSLSCFEPSLSTVTNNSFNEENLKQLIQKVTKQDLLLSIVNKLVEETERNENVELKNKIQKIIKFNHLKAAYEENNLEQVLVVGSDQFNVGSDRNDMKLNQQEADALNEAVEKCVDQMYAHTILEKRHSSTKSSLDRIQDLQSKITAKYHAIESVLTSIGNTQDKILQLSTEEYHRSVVQDSYKMAAMSATTVNRLHAQAALTLGTDGVANMSQTLQSSHQPSSSTDLNESFFALDDSISTLECSISSLKLEKSDLEERLARHKQLKSNPGSAAVYERIRKLQNAIKQKRFILKQLMGSD
ncbi:hypothetical protein WDU94_002975, partial [Cyamophila willieti]